MKVFRFRRQALSICRPAAHPTPLQTEQGVARTPASFCGMARHFRERKFRLDAGCCRTIAPEATSARKGLRQALGKNSRRAREKVAQPSGAPRQAPHSVAETL